VAGVLLTTGSEEEGASEEDDSSGSDEEGSSGSGEEEGSSGSEEEEVGTLEFKVGSASRFVSQITTAQMTTASTTTMAVINQRVPLFLYLSDSLIAKLLLQRR